MIISENILLFQLFFNFQQKYAFKLILLNQPYISRVF